MKGKEGTKKGGKKQGGNEGNTDSESDTTRRKPTSEYPGTDLSSLSPGELCCAHFCWVRKDGTSCCLAHRTGKECRNGKHTTTPSRAMKGTKLFNRLIAERGQPNVPAIGPPPPTEGAAAAVQK